jgi:hypothetical protein
VSVPCTVVTNMPKNLMVAALDLGTLKAMLVDDAYTPDQDALDFINDVSSNEAAGTGYVAGGFTLGTPVVNTDTATNTSTLDADDIDGAGVSVPAMTLVLYIDTGTEATSPVLCYFDLANGGGVNVTFTTFAFDPDGIIPLLVA